jgi:Protein of unknown function (DUF2971)
MGQFVAHAPEILYKYRSDVGRDLKCLLVDRCLYLASPLKLNDPFDCFPGVDVPTPPNIEQFISAEIAKLPPECDKEDAWHRCHLLLTSEVHRQRFGREFYRKDIGRLGVLSLSAPRDEPLLWAHYANNAAGFSVGYRARDDGEFEALGALPIKYSTQRPAINPFGGENWLEILFIKSGHWAYEREWRYVRMINDGGVGLMTVPANSIVEVCLGPNMSAFDREVVVEAARKLPDRPRILQVQLKPKRYGLTFCQLE